MLYLTGSMGQFTAYFQQTNEASDLKAIYFRMNNLLLSPWVHPLDYKASTCCSRHDDVIKWKHFLRCWSSVGGEFTGHRGIFWTNVDPIHWRIYAALGGYELRQNENTLNNPHFWMSTNISLFKTKLLMIWHWHYEMTLIHYCLIA